MTRSQSSRPRAPSFDIDGTLHVGNDLHAEHGMRRQHDLVFPRRTQTAELILRLPDGSPWSLTFSRGIERFIGYYPRLDGIDAGSPLLAFTDV